ncbi:MAG: hypothetical protein KA988_01475 [Longilinea sp.]|nr:hypothetical protein [Longilinea sp.]MCA1954430.1 hypothetical protein [Anaerolinea sp.]
MNSTLQKIELHFWTITTAVLESLRPLFSALHHPGRTSLTITLQPLYYPIKGLEFRPLIRIALLSAATGFFTGVLLRILIYGA